MAYETDISRQEFNDINMAREYAYQVGLLLSDQLGKMSVYASNYAPTSSTITIGEVYEAVLQVKDVTDNTTTDYTFSHTAVSGDTVSSVLTELGDQVLANASDHLIANVYVDYTSDTDMHMFFVPKDGYSLTEISITNLMSDGKAWTDSDTPASYVAYGKSPTAGYPRIIVTPMVQNTICSKMEESVMLVDGVETEYTSSYITYSLNVTCEAGDTETVLRTGRSAQNILNSLRKRLVNEIIHKRVQNAMNSVVHPMGNIIPSPLMEYTQYMSIARATCTFDCIDVYYPEEEAGFIDQINIDLNYNAAGSDVPLITDEVIFTLNEDL